MSGRTLLVLLLATQAWAAGQVQVWNALGTPGAVTVSGRVLEHRPTHGNSALSKNLRRLLPGGWEGAEVEISFADQKRKVTTDADGAFSAEFTAPEGHPFPEGYQAVTASSPGADRGSAVVDVVSADAPFFVICDFDDTLAVSDVQHRSELLKNVLLRDELTQAPVPGMAEFIGALRNASLSRPGFALVSGSPKQFSFRSRQFLFKNGFPLFGEYLRDLGPSTLSDYKQPVIRELLKAVPNPVVLVGDSGEHDPEVYAQIRAEFPERVKAIFIHNVGRDEVPARFEGMTLFTKAEDAVAAARRLKLIQETK